VTRALAGPRLRLRSLESADLAALAVVRAEPGICEWWGAPQAAEFEQDEGEEVFVIDVDGVVGGAIQYAEVTEPQYRSAGIDIFLGAAWQGRGLGQEAIATLARHLFEERGHHRLTIDPAAANLRAIRCYEAVGFRRVGIMRQYERTDDGPWHDGLLLELLAADWQSR
jgi:aminoglycoside 6'-N-acetyltransferase